MKTPRQLYILISKSRKARPTMGQGWYLKKEADEAAKERNEHPSWPETDWRVEKFVKGD